MISDINCERDPLLTAMAGARDSRATLKLRFMLERSKLPGDWIFVFEGVGDVDVYSQWVRRINDQAVFYPFICGGKRKVLDLHSSLKQDLNNILEKTLFFVDRDFDDLMGREGDRYIFMTDIYSVENYMVNMESVAEIIRCDFRCALSGDRFADIRAMFEAHYDQFLEITRDINRHYFHARRQGLEILDCPDRISSLAYLTIAEVAPPRNGLDVTLHIVGELDRERITQDDCVFHSLEPKSRFRGKFAFLFLQKILRILLEDYRKTTESVFFGEVHERYSPAISAFTLSEVAARSPIPNTVRMFVTSNM